MAGLVPAIHDLGRKADRRLALGALHKNHAIGRHQSGQDVVIDSPAHVQNERYHLGIVHRSNQLSRLAPALLGTV
ncbi:hypothetical protein [Phreatobacter stygius]|uniref:Uncharacterized protein n=1 Tax=Phreatobacter stygius TaxID=1940610 RepID=A0A4D7BBU2_9HYPH|nr:hypothetical protein [Phreatobacter stygius]QCI68205.1 hypothetical protein E8M01_30655 [Phreatobacter stygius]